MRSSSLRALVVSLLLAAVTPASGFAAKPSADSNPRTVGPYSNPISKKWRAQGCVVIGAMGGAGRGAMPRKVVLTDERLGQAIAQAGAVALTGACPGRPDSVIRGARAAGGRTVGISPWSTLEAHIKSGAPANFDVLKLTKLPPVLRDRKGQPNLMGRELDNIRHSDGVVIVGGRWGTLGELAIAVEFQRPIGVLVDGQRGIARLVKTIERESAAAGKKTGAPIITDSNPGRLIRRLVKAVAEQRAAGGSSEPLPDR